MRCVLPLFLTLTACGGDVAAEMERGIERSNDAIAFALLASEGVAWVDAKDSNYRPPGDAEWGVAPPPGSRHGAPGDCPTIERDPFEGSPFTLIATYGGGGCVSGSRLIPATLLGKIALTGDEQALNMDFGAVEIGLARVPEGVLAGTRLGASTEHYSVSGRLDLPETPVLDPIGARVHLTIDHRNADQVRLDGRVVLDEVGGEEPLTVVLDNVVLDLEDISGECPVPHKGTATVESKPEILVDFTDADEDDRVLVERRGRVSTPTRLCSFASDVF